MRTFCWSENIFTLFGSKQKWSKHFSGRCPNIPTVLLIPSHLNNLVSTYPSSCFSSYFSFKNGARTPGDMGTLRHVKIIVSICYVVSWKPSYIFKGFLCTCRHNWYVVAPLREKASPLEKDKASGASKDWSLCPLELLQALLELLHAPLQLIWAPLELPKAPM